MAITQKTLTKEILKVLEEDKDRTWTMNRLVGEVGVRLNYNNSRLTRNAVKVLCLSGRIDSYCPTYGNENRISSIRFKELMDEDTFTMRQAQQVEEIANLKSELAIKVEEVRKAKEARQADKVVEVRVYKTAKGKPVVIKELFHDKFERIHQLAKARKNIFLYGPTGCGKSFICEQVAKSLGLKFSFVSCTAGMSEGVLGGRLLPTGAGGKFEYVISKFVEFYEKGGMFLLDEIDAADPNVMLLINAALASDEMAVPNRPSKPHAKKHKDFVCIAAANTVGTGADRQFSGRNKLDAATLDRFQVGKVRMDYDLRVEKQLCPDEELFALLLEIRKAINEHRLERAMSTRFMIDAYEMKHDPKKRIGSKWTHEQILEGFFEGWREDELNKVRDSVPALQNAA